MKSTGFGSRMALLQEAACVTRAWKASRRSGREHGKTTTPGFANAGPRILCQLRPGSGSRGEPGPDPQHVADFRHLVHDLVHADRREINEHELRNGDEAGEGRAEGRADDSGSPIWACRPRALAPNSSNSPLVTAMAPPNLPTSSPMMKTRSSRLISSLSARRMASLYVILPSRPRRPAARPPWGENVIEGPFRRRLGALLGESHRRGQLRLHLCLHRGSGRSSTPYAVSSRARRLSTGDLFFHVSSSSLVR